MGREGWKSNGRGREEKDDLEIEEMRIDWEWKRRGKGRTGE